MSYLSHSEEDRQYMLSALGMKDEQELFDGIPEVLRIKGLNIPNGISEFEVSKLLEEKASRYDTSLTSYLGGGIYNHIIPSVVDYISSRGEFYTAYTPYQPEASQGTLQSLFEYQTAVCELTGMEVSNASMYDGSTALAEAILMALRIKRKKSRIVISETVNPIYRSVCKTYLNHIGTSIDEVSADDVLNNPQAILDSIDDDTAAVVVQNPDFFGNIHDLSKLFSALKEKGIICIQVFYPISLGLIQSPGEAGADIAVADGQSLGMPLSFGGPYLGILTTTRKHLRKIPGRIAGETTDTEGQRGYVLTLQAREQHIRREKATSNICSNQGLCALRALIFLSTIGPKGLEQIAVNCYDKTQYLIGKLREISCIKIENTQPVFNEFTFSTPVPARELTERMLKKGIAAGLTLGNFYSGKDNTILTACTEKHTKQDLDTYVNIISEELAHE